MYLGICFGKIINSVTLFCPPAWRNFDICLFHLLAPLPLSLFNQFSSENSFWVLSFWMFAMQKGTASEMASFTLKSSDFKKNDIN